jgi:phage terminase large subunit-like protein
VNRYVRSAIGYAEQAAGNAGGQFGQRIVKAAKRFLRDLSADSPDWYFDADYALDACAFVEQLPHIEGKWATPVIRLEPFQCFALCQLFGFRHRAAARNVTINLGGRSVPYRPRRFTSMLYCTARKSAKSTLAASIALYLICREQEDGQQIYSAANTFSQAMPIWGAAQKMVEKCQPLRERFGLHAWAKQITQRSAAGSFKPLHAKASTQDGLNPSGCFFDEVHAAKTPDLINVLTSAAGARKSPLFAYMTTEGYISAGPWGEIRMFADKVLDGIFEADHHLVLFWSVDQDDDEFDERCWVKANPLMLSNPHLLTAIRKEAEEAKGMPSKLAEFRIKRLNRESNPPNAWINIDKWNACDGQPVTPEDFRGLLCYGGLDLASTNDLASFRVVAEHPTRGLITYGRRWVPSSAVKTRTERGTVPYLGWVTGGLLEVIEGDTIDNRVIKQAVLDWRNTYGLELLAGDPWNGRQLFGELIEAGVEVQEFVQGAKSYHPVMQEFEKLYLAGRFAHGGDPVLKWCASNLVVRYDVNLNMAPDKKRAPEKIDDAVALLMAYGALLTSGDTDLSGVFGDPLHA